MATLTLHADDYLADAVRAAADEAGHSINVYLKELISASLGLSARPRKATAFMNVKHRLTESGTRELLSVQESFFKIDEGLWTSGLPRLRSRMAWPWLRTTDTSQRFQC